MQIARLGLMATIVMCSVATVQQTIPNQGTCPNCVIETRLVLRIGAPTGPSALPAEPADVAVDEGGRYWVVLYEHPVMVFDAEGRFQQEVGGLGEGPGEFVAPFRATMADDLMLIAEYSGRVTVFGPGFDHVRSVRLPIRISEIAVLEWPDSVLVSGSFGSPEGVGFPLHLVDMSAEPAVVLSFGPDPDGELRPGQEWTLTQRLGVPEGTSIWATDRFRYRATKWTSEGKLVDSLVRDPAWFTGLSSGAVGLPDTPPDPRMVGAISDTNGYLWVFSHVPGPRWRESWAERVEQYGAPPPGAREVPARMVPTPVELYSTMVEVLDLENRRVVARDKLDEYIIDLLPDGRAVGYREPEPDYHPALEILSFELTGVGEEARPAAPSRRRRGH